MNHIHRQPSMDSGNTQSSDLGSTSAFLKYVSAEFLGKDDVNHYEVSQLLKQIRLSHYWPFKC